MSRWYLTEDGLGSIETNGKKSYKLLIDYGHVCAPLSEIKNKGHRPS